MSILDHQKIVCRRGCRSDTQNLQYEKRFSFSNILHFNMSVQSENVGVAFGLVIAAGAATALGAAIVFMPTLVKLANRNVLAGSLGFSAGVMVYISFADILFKSLSSFEEGGVDSDRAYIYTSLCFFLGILVVMESRVAKLDHHLEI
jgi:zinc transporter ZupT